MSALVLSGSSTTELTLDEHRANRLSQGGAIHLPQVLMEVMDPRT